MFGAAVPLVVAALLVASPGCASRRALHEGDLAGTANPQAREQVRVYPSDRMVTVYEQSPGADEADPTQQMLKVVVGRDTAGAIVGEDDRDGRRRLWITFDPTCREAECAFGFVESDDGGYVLADAPSREGFEAPVTYVGSTSERNRLDTGGARIHLEIDGPLPEPSSTLAGHDEPR